MTAGYASPEEHLDDLLALLRAALAVAIERKRGADATAIAARTAAVSEIEARIKTRLQADGVPLPLERLRRGFGLSAAQRQLHLAIART